MLGCLPAPNPALTFTLASANVKQKDVAEVIGIWKAVKETDCAKVSSCYNEAGAIG
jgi:hypothetical protein